MQSYWISIVSARRFKIALNMDTQQPERVASRAALNAELARARYNCAVR